MSSTPGMPLTVDFITNTKEENIKYHWVAEKGTFLDWNQDNGKINILGNDVKRNGNKIYWSVDTNSKINESSFKIYLKLEDDDTSKVIYETSIDVEQKKEGLFSIKR